MLPYGNARPWRARMQLTPISWLNPETYSKATQRFLFHVTRLAVLAGEGPADRGAAEDAASETEAGGGAAPAAGAQHERRRRGEYLVGV